MCYQEFYGFLWFFFSWPQKLWPLNIFGVFLAIYELFYYLKYVHDHCWQMNAEYILVPVTCANPGAVDTNEKQASGEAVVCPRGHEVKLISIRRYSYFWYITLKAGGHRNHSGRSQISTSPCFRRKKVLHEEEGACSPVLILRENNPSQGFDLTNRSFNRELWFVNGDHNKAGHTDCQGQGCCCRHFMWLMWHWGHRGFKMFSCATCVIAVTATH